MTLPNRKSHRIKDYDYSQHGAYFLTICTKDRKKLLSKISVSDITAIQLSHHGQIAETVLRQMDAFYDHLSVDKYVIMPDHIHLLIVIHSKVSKTDLSDKTSIIAQFVGTFKRFCNKQYGENIWQNGYYDHVIRNRQDYDEIRIYIDNNPRKWILNCNAP